MPLASLDPGLTSRPAVPAPVAPSLGGPPQCLCVKKALSAALHVTESLNLSLPPGDDQQPASSAGCGDTALVHNFPRTDLCRPERSDIEKALDGVDRFSSTPGAEACPCGA